MPSAFAVSRAQETQKDHGTDEETRVVSLFNFYGFLQWGSSARNLVYLQGGDAVLVLNP